MTFSAAFPSPIKAPFGAQAGAAAAPWYLAGGVSAASCVAAYQPKGAASLSASYTNLNNPGTNNAAPGTAPTWDAVNGWKFAAASLQYLTTGITPPATATWTFFVVFTNGGAGALFGQLRTGQNAHLILPSTGGTSHQYRNGSETAVNVAPALTASTLAMAGTKAYRDGVDDGVSLASGGGTPYEIYIGSLHRGSGTISNSYTGYIQFFAVYNTALSAAQNAAIYAAAAAI